MTPHHHHHRRCERTKRQRELTRLSAAIEASKDLQARLEGAVSDVALDQSLAWLRRQRQKLARQRRALLGADVAGRKA